MALSEQGQSLGPSTLGRNYYEYDHYSGSQIVVMIGDVVIDNAVAVQYDVQQSKTPVYGYASQYYTFVADGHVLVQGALTIAFKEAGYLLWPIQRYINLVGDGRLSGGNKSFQTASRFSTRGNEITRGYKPSDNTLMEASRAAEDKTVMRANVEQVMEWTNPKRADASTPIKNNSSYNNFLTSLGHLPDGAFEDWAEVFEDAIWYGSDPTNPMVRDKLFAKTLPESVTEIKDEDVLNHRRPDLYPSIDIQIVYGDMSEQAPNHTVRKLLDVSFVGSSQTIEISGQPIFEQYTFIARNLV
jgi:hypothetical protein